MSTQPVTPLQQFVQTVDPYHHDAAQVTAHAASLGALFATAMGYLPVLIAIVPAIYYAILTYESKTVQRWLRRRRLRKRLKRIARRRKG